jgi:hypothetical protein
MDRAFNNAVTRSRPKESYCLSTDPMCGRNADGGSKNEDDGCRSIDGVVIDELADSTTDRPAWSVTNGARWVFRNSCAKDREEASSCGARHGGGGGTGTAAWE